VETAPERAAMADAIHALTLVLTPFAPHICDEIAQAYGAKEVCVAQAWPSFDPALVVDDTVPYAVQVNGKLRSEIRMPVEAGETDVRRAAEAEEKVKQSLAGKQLKRVVFVPKRLINFVVAG
jgi:leucyl-tRNA synthetase